MDLRYIKSLALRPSSIVQLQAMDISNSAKPKTFS